MLLPQKLDFPLESRRSNGCVDLIERIHCKLQEKRSLLQTDWQRDCESCHVRQILPWCTNHIRHWKSFWFHLPAGHHAAWWILYVEKMVKEILADINCHKQHKKTWTLILIGGVTVIQQSKTFNRPCFPRTRLLTLKGKEKGKFVKK